MWLILVRGIAGDLYIFIHVDEKDGVWREGLHLYSKINIDFTEAILGSVKKVILMLVQLWRCNQLSVTDIRELKLADRINVTVQNGCLFC